MIMPREDNHDNQDIAIVAREARIKVIMAMILIEILMIMMARTRGSITLQPHFFCVCKASVSAKNKQTIKQKTTTRLQEKKISVIKELLHVFMFY